MVAREGVNSQYLIIKNFKKADEAVAAAKKRPMKLAARRAFEADEARCR